MGISSYDTLPQYGSNVSTGIGLIELCGSTGPEVMRSVHRAVGNRNARLGEDADVLISE
jgi:hypothetical protein